MEYHVAKNGSDHGEGTKQDPFLTINKAASVAVAGDIVTVHEGVYREWVKPKYKGLSDCRRIIYQVAEGENVIIKGSEVIENWQHVKGTIWRADIDNDLFGTFNPYQEKIFGDWLVTIDETKHLGDVYLNGMSFYEVSSFEELKAPELKAEGYEYQAKQVAPACNRKQAEYVWYAEVGQTETTIYANFQDANPNEELVEINVRRSCFYPEETGIDYITVRGFEMAHAATPWSPPTADQPGLIGPNWSKGWLIEDNIIHDAKCSAISIGKEKSTGHHYRSIRKDKPGYLYQLEAVFTAERSGWSKESIGSHIIRNNTIYNCGQNGIVGHLGCVFSEIYDNHIFNVGLKREFFGHEIAGIKLHAAIDVQICHNRIHDCTRGLWLDWQTQGTRITRNIFYQNNRDLYVEVSHGPYLVDHNILGSQHALDNFAQGGAYVNNLFAGKMVQRKVLDRATQYHLPHSTKVAGFAPVYGGDDRFYNNLYFGKEGIPDVGTSHFKGYPTSLEKYIEAIEHGDHEKFAKVEQPVYINCNAYFNGANAYENEEHNWIEADFDPKFEIIDQGDEVYLSCVLPDSFEQMLGHLQSTETLARVRIVDCEFENPDGTKLVIDQDLLNQKRSKQSSLGPLTELKKGKNRIKVWG